MAPNKQPLAKLDTFFGNLWQDYINITPSAHKIHALLSDGVTPIINDHVAFRTFNQSPVGLSTLAQHFEAMGYEEKGHYHFAQKKLDAKHYEHPDETQPKIFISELRVEDFSKELRTTVDGLLQQMDSKATSSNSFLYSGRHWQLSYKQYQELLQESEYAAWVAAWGYRANHFTIGVDYLTRFGNLERVNDALKEAGFVLNTSGGEIKGGPDVFLAQSSTMADQVQVAFSDQTVTLPSCFYEFAQRYQLPDGKRYQGFVEASADKIFESTTDKR